MFELPSNVKIDINSTSVNISFDKSAEVVATSIDAYWINGQGTYDNETTGTYFIYDGLSLGTIYKFKLKVRSSDGTTLESGEYSFSTPAVIVPTAPTNILATVDSTIKNKVTISFTKGSGLRTEIDAYWVNGQGTWDNYTADESFVFENLAWGTQYKFKLRSVSNDGVTVAESSEITFNIEDQIIEVPPTPPTNIKVDVKSFVVDNEPKNTVTISFTKGDGIKTDIDAYWINGQGTYDSVTTTTDNTFVFNNLPFGATYKFKLRTTSYSGDKYAQSEEITFSIDPIVIPTVPTNISTETLSEFKVNDVNLKFQKGVGDSTEILKSWGDNANTWVAIENDDDLSFKDLDFGTTHYFKLRSVTNFGLNASTDMINFTIPKAIHPTIPLNIIYEIDQQLLNKVVITFNKGAGLKTELDLNSAGAWSEFTTDNGFILEHLKFGDTYTFQLRSVGNTGEVALSPLYTFKINEILETEMPSNIEVIRNRRHVIIQFTKGANAVTTEISKHWISKEFTDSTDGTEFDLGELEPGKKYYFKIRSVGTPFMDEDNNKTPNIAVSKLVKIVMPPYLAPYLIDYKIEIEGYNAYVKFGKFDGIRIGIRKYWLHDGNNDKEEQYIESYKWKYDNPDYSTDSDDDDIQFPDHVSEFNEVSPYHGAGANEKVPKNIEEVVNYCDEITTDRGFALERLFAGEHKLVLYCMNYYDEFFPTQEITFNIDKGYTFILTNPTLPTDISFVPECKACAVKFHKGNGVRTEMNRNWEDDPLTFGIYTTDNAFYIEDLEPNSNYYFKLKTVNTLGKSIESDYYSFTTLADDGTGDGSEEGADEEYVADKPTVPTDISFVPEGTCCTIKFKKGVASRTEICRLWKESEGTYGEYTLKEAFYYDELEVGKKYYFKLRSKNSLGETAETETLSFHTASVDDWCEDKPTLPTDINYIIEGKCFTVKFTKGVGSRTEIDRHWMEPAGTWGEYTHKDGFYYEDLEPGVTYAFKLRSKNSLGETVETEELKVRTKKDGGGDGYYVDVSGDVPQGYYSNYEEKWFYTPTKDGTPVGVTSDIKNKFDTYGAYYRGNPNLKAVYLTFDEGYEAGNTAKILDTLKNNDIKSTFFITKKYLTENPELVKRIVREGHTVGNHSSTHPSMANVRRDKGFEGIEEEIKGLETAFKDLTGADLIKFFRPPMGKYSEEVLVDIKKLGYKIMFWSFAYSDFDIDHQKEYDWVLDYAKSSEFNGCVYLLHAVSSTNAAILDEFIKSLKESGYDIRSLKTLEYDCQSV